jgi:hypothetical protein
LPKRPEDIVAPTSLNSEGEEQANSDQKEDSVNEGTPKAQKSSPPTVKPPDACPEIVTLRPRWRTGRKSSALVTPCWYRPA